MLLGCWWGVVALVRAGVPAVGRLVAAAGHPFAVGVGGMMGCAAEWSAGSIRGLDRASGGHDLHDPRRPATGAAVHAARVLG